jgi:hypothetical protein
MVVGPPDGAADGRLRSGIRSLEEQVRAPSAASGRNPDRTGPPHVVGCRNPQEWGVHTRPATAESCLTDDGTGDDMRTIDAPRHRRLVLGLLPLMCAGALVAAPFASAADSAAGVVEARAVLVPAPSADQMMMPMDAGMQHADEVQVVLELRNDTDAEQTVPVDRVALIGAAGERVGATGGLVGDLVLRPHAGAEERLRFPAQGGDRLRLSVPEAGGERVLDLPVTGATATTPNHHH